MIFSDVLKAVAQLGDGRFLRVMVLGVVLALALLFGVYAGLILVIDWLVPGSITLPLVGEVGGVATLLGWASMLVMLVLSVFLMMPVAAAFTAFFLDEVADAVEVLHYPGLPPAEGMGIWEALADGLGFLGLRVVVNLVSLVAWPVLGPLMPLLAWAINGYLLGREYFTLVAARRIGRQAAMALRQRHGGQVWLAGALMALPLAFPLVNLVVPVLGVATFTHLFHRLNRA